MEPVRIYSAYDHPPKVRLDFAGEKSLTRQSEAEACDVNVIMRRYEKTGVLPVMDREAFFADVVGIGDFRESLDRVEVAESLFMALPAAVRARFDNDAAVFLDFASDEKNHDELVKMGLVEAPSESAPAAAVSVPPPADKDLAP